MKYGIILIMTAEEYRIKIENQILEIITTKLKDGSLDSNRAKAIAKMVLEKLKPPLTLEQINEIVPSFDDDFPELSPIVVPIIKAQDEKISNLITGQIHTLLTENKITEANNLLDQALKNKN